MKTLPFNQFDFESDQADVLKHGDHVTIAKFHGTSPTLHDQQLNKTDERKSNCWRAIVDIVGLSTEAPDRAEKLLSLFNSYVMRGIWALHPELQNICLETQAGSVATEFSEFAVALFTGKPLSVQLTEIEDVIREAEKFKKGLLEEINREANHKILSINRR
jgi:hypothetical protein